MCKRYELSKTELLSKKKTLDIVRARNIIHNLLNEKYKMNLSNIGRHFKQDHTTVLHSIKMKLNKEFCMHVIPKLILLLTQKHKQNRTVS